MELYAYIYTFRDMFISNKLNYIKILRNHEFYCFIRYTMTHVKCFFFILLYEYAIKKSKSCAFYFFKLYTFILLTSTIVPGINYFVILTHPLHQLQVRKRRTV